MDLQHMVAHLVAQRATEKIAVEEAFTAAAAIEEGAMVDVSMIKTALEWQGSGRVNILA